MVNPPGTPHLAEVARVLTGSVPIALQVRSFLCVGPIVSSGDLVAVVPSNLAALVAEHVDIELIDPPMKFRGFDVAMACHRRAHRVPGPELLRYVLANNAQAEQSVACNAVHDVPARLARWLLMTQDRTGHRILPLTQEYLAVMVGVQRTTISVAATAFKDAGIIRYSRGQIEVTDRAKLEGRACECYRSIHEVFERLLKANPRD